MSGQPWRRSETARQASARRGSEYRQARYEVRAIYCCSRPANRRIGSKARFVIGNGWADCSDTTIGKPQEFFDPTTMRTHGAGLFGRAASPRSGPGRPVRWSWRRDCTHRRTRMCGGFSTRWKKSSADREMERFSRPNHRGWTSEVIPIDSTPGNAMHESSPSAGSSFDLAASCPGRSDTSMPGSRPAAVGRVVIVG